MARMLKFTSAVVLVLAAFAGVAAARTQHVCLQYGLSGAGSFFYEITADDTQTKFDRYDMTKNPPQLVDSNTFGSLATTADDAWDAGVAFANELRSRGLWINNNEAVTSAHWTDDTWRFETTLFGQPLEVTFSTATCATIPTAAPTPAQVTPAPVVTGPPVTTPPPSPPSPTPAQATSVPAVPEPPATTPSFNCAYAGSNNGGIMCTDDEVCCGGGTITPQCLPKDSDRKCCTHYIAATTCNASESCCGAYGVGASSSAFCCGAGSTCCHAQSMSQGAACCPTGSTCCAGTTVGLCCAFGQVCNAIQNTCDPAGTPAQNTNAPAVPEPTQPTAAPTTMQATNAPGTCIVSTTAGAEPTPGAQPTQPADQPPAPVTTSILVGNVPPPNEAAAFSGSSAWMVAAASVATACVAVLA